MMDDDSRVVGPPRGAPYEQQPQGGPGPGPAFDDGGAQHRDVAPARSVEREHRAPPAAKSTNPADHTGVLKMRGLPFSATKQDIIAWFSDMANLNGDGCVLGFLNPTP